LWIQSLKAEVETCRLQSIAFAKEFERSTTFEEKTKVEERWDRVTEESRSLQIALDRLEEPGAGSSNA
jgi:hypothetical protein